MAGRKPNFLIFMLDQLAPQFLPFHGHGLVKAPNLSALAEKGVIFDNAYCNYPICAPARYSFMSGRLPSNIEAWDNAAEFRAEIPTFAHHLADLGYDTTLSGKMHFCGPDQLHGFHRRLTTDVYPADFTWTPDWDHPEILQEWYHSMEVVRQAGICTRSNNLDYDDETVFAAKRHLFDLARKRDETPFLLVVSLISPHDPYIARAEHWNRYNHADIDMPKLGINDVPMDPHSKRFVDSVGMASPLPSDEQIRNARHAYYASVSYLDDKFGEMMQSLEESGKAEDTVVIVLSDHGDMLGERGLWFKMSWFEQSARVPLIIHAPKMFAHRRISAAVSQVDILPTLVDLACDGAGVNANVVSDGNSLVPFLSGGKGTDLAIGEYLGECITSPYVMIRRGDLKFIHCAGDPDQLFDVRADPNERNNLVGKAQFRQAHEDFKKETAKRWDFPALNQRIVESQRRRRFINPILRKQNISWDYQPFVDAKQAYVRNSLPLYDLERRSRFP
jgi:choline-sulfatase